MADNKNIEDELKTVKDITNLTQKLAKQLESDFDAASSSVEDFVKSLQKSKREFSDIEKSSAGILDFTKKVDSRTEAIEGLQKLINAGATKQLNIGEQISESAKLVTLAGKGRTEENKKLLSLETELAGLDIQKIYYQEKLNKAFERGLRDEISAIDHAKELTSFSSQLANVEKERVKALDQKNELDGTNYNQLLAQKKLLDCSLSIHQKILAAENSRQSKLMVINSLFSKTLAKNEDFIKLAILGGNLMKGGATAYVAILEVAIDRWIQLDKAAEEFRKLTGLVTTQMLHIDKAVREINTEFAYMGVTLDKAYLSAQALYGAFQTSHLVTKDMISFTSRIAENLGIIPTDVAKFSSMFSEIVKSTGSTTKNIVMTTAALASAAGVAPREVMTDIANASETTLSFLAKNPMALMRAAVEARRLGTSLDSISKSGRSMLNYQESMTAELEASALLNQNISFQRSRQLAWEGKLQDSRNEALRQISKAGDFTRLNVYQQESLARAAGMTVDEVIKQQNQQKLLNNLRRTNPALVKEYDDMLAKTKLTGKAAEDAANKEYEAMIKKQLMQGEMTKLTNSLYAAWISISDALLPIANAIMPPILFAVRSIGMGFKLIGAIIKGILTPMDSIAKKMRLGEDGSKKMENVLENISKLATELAPKFEFIGKVIGYAILPMLSILGVINMIVTRSGEMMHPIRYIADGFAVLSRQMGNFGRGLSGLSSIFRPFITMGSLALRFLGTLTRFLGPIGLIVSAVTFVIDLFSQWMDIWSSDDMDMGTKILKSLVAVPSAIWNTLFQPIVDGLDWVMKKMGIAFNLGDFLKSMYNDVVDLGSYIFTPLADAWINITKIFDGDGRIGMKILKGIGEVSWSICKALLFPFNWAFDKISDWWIGHSPSGIGLAIVDGIKSVGSMVLDVLTWPFRTAWGLVSKIFSGEAFGFIMNTFSEFGPKIVEAIKSASDQIYNFITSPFKKAWEFIKSMPIVNKIFGGAKDITANISDQVKSTIETATKSVVEIKNLDSLKEVVAQLTAAVVKLGGTAGSAATVVNTTPNDNSAMIAKLDELIGLLKSGGIAVNLDGRKVSSGLSVAGR